MRVLLAIMDAGGGHRSAARAIATAMSAQAPDVWLTIRDVARGAPIVLINDPPRTYRMFVETPLRPVHEVAWRAFNGRVQGRAFIESLYPLLRRHLLAVLRRHQPEMVVALNPGVVQVLANVRRDHHLPFRLATVVTDIVNVHALWADTATDLCIVPTEEAERVVLRQGITHERIRRVGFPIHPEFARLAGNGAAPVGLGHPPRVLLMGGGAGMGGVEPMLRGLERVRRPLRIEVVCGHNPALYERLRQTRWRHDVRVHGFVSEMAALMATCDVVVSKAGPGSLMEAWSLGKPTLVGQRIGPQEIGNLEWGQQRGLAWPAGSPKEVGERLEHLLGNWRTVRAGMQPVPVDGAHRTAEALLELLPRCAPAVTVPRSPRELVTPLLQPATPLHGRNGVNGLNGHH